MTAKKVVITGIGMVTPLGNCVADTWDALMQQKSGIAPISLFDASALPTRIAAEVKAFNFDERFKDEKLKRYMLPQVTFAVAAAQEAFDDAGIRPTDATSERWGAVSGSGLITELFSETQAFHQRYYHPETGLDYAKLGREGGQHFSPYSYGRNQTNAALALLHKIYNIRGYSMSVHTACASSGHSIGLGLQAIRRGHADYVLVGGFDSMINPIGVSGFCLLGALSTDNDTPTSASRPFDLTRGGFVLGEGAAFFILESETSAKQRGAKIYAELAGEGNSLSAYRITDSHPSGDGAIQAIQGAIKDAKLNLDEIDYINAHGTSTKMNDFSETNAIKAVFGERAYQIPISSTKSQTGHLISAAGALEAAFATLAIHHQRLPMTKNREKPDPDCDLDYITEGPRTHKVRAALSNSFGFGGSNSAIVLKQAEV